MASALLPTDTFRFLIGGTRASVGLISGYLLTEIPRTFRLSVLLRKVHAPGRLDGNFWGLGVHPLHGIVRVELAPEEALLYASDTDDLAARAYYTERAGGAVWDGIKAAVDSARAVTA